MKSRTDSWAVVAEALKLVRAGQVFAMATVWEVVGSTPAHAGAKALIGCDGVWAGTVGGGAVEAEAVRRAAAVLRGGGAALFDFALDGVHATDGPPVCGGAMRVLMQLATQDLAEVWARVLQTERRANGRERGMLLTTVRFGNGVQATTRWLTASELCGHSGVPTADELGDCLQRETVRLFSAEAAEGDARLEVLVEPVVPKPVLLIVGGGHVGQAVAVQANLVGFELAVLDDRPEFTQASLFPDGTTFYCRPIGEGVAAFPVDGETYIVIVTRDHQHDAEALMACIHRSAAYLGLIGSRRKVAVLRADVVESGRATAAEFARVYAPIGIDLGAATVPEIATSIVAQLIAVRRLKTAPRFAAALS